MLLTSYDGRNTIVIPVEVYPRLAEAISSVLTAVRTGLESRTGVGATTVTADLQMRHHLEVENRHGIREPGEEFRTVELPGAGVLVSQHPGYGDRIIMIYDPGDYDPEEENAPREVLSWIECDLDDEPYVDDLALPRLEVSLDEAERLIAELHDAARLGREIP